MTKFEMQRDAVTVWTTRLQVFTNLYAQCNAYSDNRAANSGFDSTALVHKYPPNQSNRTIASTTSSITSHDLYVKSLEESLAATHTYVARERALAVVTNPAALLCAELQAQRKQFDLIMKQNADLLTAMAKNRGGGGGGGRGGGSGSGSRGCCSGGGCKCSPMALCPN